mmetsp:Transcript_17485/g.25877  ORF Transcript_17485/g.25877 Transcript_17485/m.25877 type:complete len:331 (-) Transcript_17485:268-1260(-)|eukprot:CAMPEP_0194029504 /NCGR_PEP_ID=MMETSP0009_2-20130614/3210_1 /TAXON_ID=210454 /ORGANISM="Grammatophora oceanica, Strain CCMP 410" /LENGTH=330 /DNA_ID=CAMNT_0038669191 /DNA_START=134 /DNA_END=1126 /DNA_ORIENTATION=+
MSSETSPSTFYSPNTTFETATDLLLGLAFLACVVISARRIHWSSRGSSGEGGGAETTVVTAFYSLILLTSTLRSIWFLVPSHVWQPSYTPVAFMAWDKEHPSWVGAFLSEIVLTAGSLGLFSIFILILVYWADILKKYFYPGSRRSRPMVTFLALVGCLIGFEVLNAFLFLITTYSSEGMILFNAILLAAVSMVCVVEITIFSHRFRTVLKTLGAINQVSTESQVQRILWITVTGNLFFFTRALLETVFAGLLISYWHHYGTVERVFSHKAWDTYVLVKHVTEVAILGLMLYILQSRFASGAAAQAEGGYESVPESVQQSKAEEAQPLMV